MIVIRMRFVAGTTHAAPWAAGTFGDIAWPPDPWLFLQRLVRAWITLGRIDRERFDVLLASLVPAPVYRLPFATSGSIRLSGAAASLVKNQSLDGIDSVLALEKAHGVEAFAIWKELTLDGDEASLLDWILGFASSETKSALHFERCTIPDCGNLFYDVEPCDSNEHGSEIILKRAAAREDSVGKSLSAAIEKSLDARSAGILSAVRTVKHYRMPQHWGTLGTPSAQEASVGQTVFRFVVEGSKQTALDVTASLPFAEAMRGAFLAVYSSLHGRPASRHLAGKNDSDGSPRHGHDHPHYLPLDLDNDGFLDAVDVFFPVNCSHDEYIALRAVKAIWGSGAIRKRIKILFCGPSPQLSGSVWQARTPIVLDRFPKRRGAQGSREVDAPVGQIQRALMRRGFPEAEVTMWHKTAIYGAGRNAAAFYQTRANQTRYPVVGATLRFDREVVGPIALGRLAHFGLGNFAPTQ